MMKAFTIMVSVIFLATIASAQAQLISDTDWPTKGRDYGRSYFVPDELPLDNGQLNLKWKRFLGERIEVEMEPLVVGNLLYIGLMNGKLYALDKDNGSTVWVYQAGMAITDTPTIAEVNSQLRIFFGSTNGIFYCLDALTGQEIWTHDTNSPIFSTPSFHNNRVFIGNIDGMFYGLDAVDGSVDWSYQTSSPISTTSALGEISPGVYAVFVATGDNMAYAFDTDGSLLWSNQMDGIFTKKTTAVYADGVVMFVTRKAGTEYSQVVENHPAILDVTRQPGPIVLDAWADFYIQYPKRRTLYYFDALTGADLWQPSINKTRYMPLYLPYWGEYSPVVDAQGNAWFAASAHGGDDALDHDMRLWKINLATGEYTHSANQDEFTHRFDEVGRASIIGDVYYQTISEDVGYFDLATKEKNNDVFGNGFWSHRYPIELDEMSGNTIFGGMHKFFTRFSGSTPGGLGGGNDVPSPLISAGNEAYYTAWGHVYALTSQPSSPIIDYGVFDRTDEPTTTLSYNQARAELNQRIQTIVNENERIGPISRMWSFYAHKPFGSHWHDGEVIRSLSEAIPFVDEPLKTQLKEYLQNQVDTYLLDSRIAQYGCDCIDYDLGLREPCVPSEPWNCNTGAGIRETWFVGNSNIMLERLYALYKYANMTGDATTIVNSWDFIKNRYNALSGSWDQEAGFFLFEYWYAGSFHPSTQMVGVYAVREMAEIAGDAATRDDADAKLTRMMEQRVYWGKYVRSLYDTGQLQRQEFTDPNSWGYQAGTPIPIEGYLDKDNDYRQIFYLERVSGNLSAEFTGYGNRVFPYEMIGYNPVYPEFTNLYRNNLSDEIMDYISTIETRCDWWYMNIYSHCVFVGVPEDDTASPLLAPNLFQLKAYVLEESFEELAPYLPWEFEDYGDQDIFRIQNLVALLNAPEGSPPICTDSDNDSYFLETGCGTLVDCNDTNPSIHPGAEEICGNGVDEDCVGGDSSCFHRADTEPPFGCITMGELTAFIARWLTDSQDVTMTEVMGAVTIWRSGEGC